MTKFLVRNINAPQHYVTEDRITPRDFGTRECAQAYIDGLELPREHALEIEEVN
jgi:hypothetical protein